MGHVDDDIFASHYFLVYQGFKISTEPLAIYAGDPSGMVYGQRARHLQRQLTCDLKGCCYYGEGFQIADTAHA
jgi:hypothetical protein